MSFVSTDPCSHNSENTWFTPAEFINLLGPFDTDPCTVSFRPFNIAKDNAEYDLGQDGLLLNWEELEEKLEVAMEALKFYADRRNYADNTGYQSPPESTIICWRKEDSEQFPDRWIGGKRARAALAKIKEMENEE